jgi:hypothetical protein
MHAGPSVTTEVLRSIIVSYRSRGFTFVTIPELLGSRRAPWAADPMRAAVRPIPV